jgi:hypothetical protein
MSPEPLKLTGRHQDTLRQIFAHPLSHNVEWHAVVALLHEVASVDERHDGKVAVTANEKTVVLERPRNKDIDADELVEVRNFLKTLGYGAQGD